MAVDLWKRIAASGNRDAVIAGDTRITHAQLAELAARYREWLIGEALPAGSIVSFGGDYSATAIALFLALLDRRAIMVPISADATTQADGFRELAETEYVVSIDDETPQLHETKQRATHAHYAILRERNAAGLVLFSSGSTGSPKAIVQDMQRLLKRFEKPGSAQRMLIFLQLDHIGGINSLLYTLANGGTLVVAPERTPQAVAATIERHRVELLPTSPTFLNLLLLSGVLEQYDLSSLKLITYGTEPMPESTLERLHAALPAARLQQTYGLSEVGILRSRSRDSDSLWMQVGGDGFETRIRDGRLWVRAESAMLGYLDAPSPFDEDGFFDTGDLVEQDGDWIRILGRDSEIINVGGEKVYPAEVESVLLAMEGVLDAIVFGDDNPITGRHVAARVQLTGTEDVAAFKLRMRRFCRERLPAFKIPARVTIVDRPNHNVRFKRIRRSVP